MELALDLAKHCILTEIKRLYEKEVRNALGQTSSCDPSPLLETLLEILETCDLKALRGRYPELSGGYGQRVWLCLTPEGVFLVFGEKRILLSATPA